MAWGWFYTINNRLRQVNTCSGRQMSDSSLCWCCHAGSRLGKEEAIGQGSSHYLVSVGRCPGETKNRSSICCPSPYS